MRMRWSRMRWRRWWRRRWWITSRLTSYLASMSSTTIPPPLSACHEVLVPTVVKNLHSLTFESHKHLHSDVFFVFKEKPVSEPKNILTISGKVDTIEFYLVNYKILFLPYNCQFNPMQVIFLSSLQPLSII